MDPYLRAFTEQFVDTHLEEKELQNIKGIVNIFKLGIKNKLDAEIGFFLGYSYADLLMQFLILNSRLPNKDEVSQCFNLIKRRFPEILAEMKKTKNLKIIERDETVTPISEVEVEPFESIQEQ